MKINNPDNRMINNAVGCFFFFTSRPEMSRSRVEVY